MSCNNIYYIIICNIEKYTKVLHGKQWASCDTSGKGYKVSNTTTSNWQELLRFFVKILRKRQTFSVLNRLIHREHLPVCHQSILLHVCLWLSHCRSRLTHGPWNTHIVTEFNSFQKYWLLLFEWNILLKAQETLYITLAHVKFQEAICRWEFLLHLQTSCPQ